MVCQSHHACKKEAIAAAEAVCAKAGARFTKARRQVFEVLWSGHKALTAADVMEKIGNNQPPITYRALEFLKQYGLIHHITSMNAYVGCVHASNESHIGHLMVCTKCRSVEEVEQKEPLEPLMQAAKTQGFHITQTHIEMLGLCRSCYQ